MSGYGRLPEVVALEMRPKESGGRGEDGPERS